uniref:Uncharacterized protein n=1 Tax=Glossina austeni TaxID=7395 RepID=A0A1A9UDJ5_GLOAU
MLDISLPAHPQVDLRETIKNQFSSLAFCGRAYVLLVDDQKLVLKLGASPHNSSHNSEKTLKLPEVRSANESNKLRNKQNSLTNNSNITQMMTYSFVQMFRNPFKKQWLVHLLCIALRRWTPPLFPMEMCFWVNERKAYFQFLSGDPGSPPIR